MQLLLLQEWSSLDCWYQLWKYLIDPYNITIWIQSPLYNMSVRIRKMAFLRRIWPRLINMVCKRDLTPTSCGFNYMCPHCNTFFRAHNTHVPVHPAQQTGKVDEWRGGSVSNLGQRPQTKSEAVSHFSGRSVLSILVADAHLPGLPGQVHYH